MAEKSDKATQFEQAAEERRPGFFAEFWDFLKHNKKWWLAPILIVLLLIGLLVVLGGTSLAPFVYTIF
jgi:hypothetical protein